MKTFPQHQVGPMKFHKTSDLELSLAFTRSVELPSASLSAMDL